MSAVRAARIIAAGKASVALAIEDRRVVTAAGFLALALSGLVLFQMLHAPAVRSDWSAAETDAAPAIQGTQLATENAAAPDIRRGQPAVERSAVPVVRPAAGDAIATHGAPVEVPVEVLAGAEQPIAQIEVAEAVAGDGPVQPPAVAEPEETVAAVVVDPRPLKALAKTQDMRSAMERAVTIRREIECLALNIYFEARGEPDIGKLAVAHVVMNRVADQRFPDSVCEVIRQGGEWPRHRCQFSWWCDGKSDKPKEGLAWRRSMTLARQVYWGGTTDPTRGALWYHADYVAPAWGQVLERAVKIGRHIFYQRRAPGVQVASAYDTTTQ